MTGKMTFQLFLPLFLSALVCQTITTAALPTVNTKSGQVSGTIERSFSGLDYLAFHSIPYAEPPTGDLRFEPPVAKTPWEGTLDGTKNGPACLQMDQFNEPQVKGAEDCLWLSVFTPSLHQNGNGLKPVLVYIHGGRFLIGTANTLIYSPNFMMDHAIVVVSIQYRMGALGFLSTGDAVAPGNYGMLDQVLALEWIQKNIAAFGGNPNHVFVSGHSAGSASAHMHLFSPLSKGLVHGAISLSGTANSHWANRITNHADIAKRQAEAVECPTDTSKELIACLKKVDAKQLTEMQWKTHDFFLKSPAKLPLSTYTPRVDKESARPFMPESALDMLRKGKFESLPWMAGFTSQEGAWYMSALYGQDSMEYLQEFDKKRMEVMRSYTTGLLNTDEEFDQLLKFYVGDNPVADQAQRVPMSEMTSDMLFTMDTVLAMYLQSRYSIAPVYFYQFNYRGEWTFAHEFEQTKHDYEGVAHLDDISFFMRLIFKPKLTEAETEVMKRFTGYIADFVKYHKPTNGDPNKEYLFHWPEYMPGHGQYMVIDTPEKSGMSRQLPFESSQRPGRIHFLMNLLNNTEKVHEDYLPNRDEL